MFISEAFTEQGSNMPDTIFHEFTGMLVVVVHVISGIEGS